MIISSLLNLQAKYVKDKDDLILFKETQTRNKSMAMLHEKLYQSGKYRSIEFGEYLKGLLKRFILCFCHTTQENQPRNGHRKQRT